MTPFETLCFFMTLLFPRRSTADGRWSPASVAQQHTALLILGVLLRPWPGSHQPHKLAAMDVLGYKLHVAKAGVLASLDANNHEASLPTRLPSPPTDSPREGASPGSRSGAR